MPRDCIDRVTSQNGDRLATPRPAPKVTLKRYWQTQQQQPQQPKLEDDTQSVWKQRATWESRAGVRDDTKHATEGRATRQLVLPTSEATDDTHLTLKEELTDTNTKAIERIKIGSNKICIQEDLANEKMMFSTESSQAIFNMGHVELIELKKTTIQCPSCWQNDATYRQSQLVHNWSDGWVRYMDHVVQFSIYHDAPQHERERNMHVLYLLSVDDNQQAPPLSQRPRYRQAKEQLRNLQTKNRERLAPFIPVSETKKKYITRLTLHCNSTLTGWAQIRKNISQKNIISHSAHPAGHQHPGGAHLHGLRTGKDGINKVGKTTDGQSNGEWNNLKLAV